MYVYIGYYEKSCHVVADNTDHYFHFGKHDQKKKGSPPKDCRKA